MDRFLDPKIYFRYRDIHDVARRVRLFLQPTLQILWNYQSVFQKLFQRGVIISLVGWVAVLFNKRLNEIPLLSELFSDVSVQQLLNVQLFFCYRDCTLFADVCTR